MSSRFLVSTFLVQAQQFEAAVKEAMAAERFEPAWYSGTEAKWQTFCEQNSNVEVIKPQNFDVEQAKGAPCASLCVITTLPAHQLAEVAPVDITMVQEMSGCCVSMRVPCGRRCPPRVQRALLPPSAGTGCRLLT